MRVETLDQSHMYSGGQGAKPPEAENLLASRCATEAANLHHSPQFANLVNPRHISFKQEAQLSPRDRAMRRVN